MGKNLEESRAGHGGEACADTGVIPEHKALRVRVRNREEIPDTVSIANGSGKEGMKDTVRNNLKKFIKPHRGIFVQNFQAKLLYK